MMITLLSATQKSNYTEKYTQPHLHQRSMIHTIYLTQQMYIRSHCLSKEHNHTPIPICTNLKANTLGAPVSPSTPDANVIAHHLTSIYTKI